MEFIQNLASAVRAVGSHPGLLVILGVGQGDGAL